METTTAALQQAQSNQSWARIGLVIKFDAHSLCFQIGLLPLNCTYLIVYLDESTFGKCVEALQLIRGRRPIQEASDTTHANLHKARLRQTGAHAAKRGNSKNPTWIKACVQARKTAGRRKPKDLLLESCLQTSEETRRKRKR